MPYMSLNLMFKEDNRIETISVKRVFQQRPNKETDINSLYYETPYDIRGKGKSIPLNQLCCWDIEV